jgi:hypothetical protein
MPKQNFALVDTTAGRSTTRRVARLRRAGALGPPAPELHSCSARQVSCVRLRERLCESRPIAHRSAHQLLQADRGRLSACSRARRAGGRSYASSTSAWPWSLGSCTTGPRNVKAGRKLGHSRRSKTRPLEGWVGGATVVAKAEPVGRGLSGDGRLSPSARGSADFGGFRADSGVEVLASESVAVAFEREDL